MALMKVSRKHLPTHPPTSIHPPTSTYLPPDPLYTFLKKSTKGFLPFAPPIPWNFGKFLVVDGVPSKRYEPTTSPLAIEEDIRKALGLE